MAGTMGIGYCKLVIESATGQVLRDGDDIIVISRSGRPDTGNWINVRGVGRFFVDRVEFFDEGNRAKNYIYPVLFLRPPGAGHTRPLDEVPGQGSVLPSNRQASTRKVLSVDFSGAHNPRNLCSDILPVNLIANLVTFGYRLQATEFDRERRDAEDALRSADRRLWALVEVLDVLSREAKSHAVRCHVFFSEGAGQPVRLPFRTDSDRAAYIPAVDEEEPDGTDAPVESSHGKPLLRLVRNTASSDEWSVG